MAHRPRRARDASRRSWGDGYGRIRCLAQGGWSCSCSRGPADSIRTPVMVPGEAVWAVVCATFVRDAHAMLPEPDHKPTPEPDDDLEDEPEDEPKDQPDDELEDDPRDEPDTLYFRREDGCTARCC